MPRAINGVIGDFLLSPEGAKTQTAARRRRGGRFTVTATYWGPVLGTVVGVILGAIIAVFAEPARNWFYGPKLFLDFQPDDGRCVADSSVARYARVFVKNRGRRHMERCQAFVTNIEREEETGQ